MPIYFFDVVHEETTIRDNEGSILTGDAAMRRDAELAVRELVTYFLLKGEKIGSHELRVRDQSGSIVLQLKFRDFVV